MTMAKRIVGVVVTLALAGVGACKKTETDKPVEPAPSVQQPARPPAEPVKAPAPKAPTGQALFDWYQGCWGHFNKGMWDDFSGCYAPEATSSWIETGMPELAGVVAIAGNAKAFREAFPDMKGTLVLTLVSGKKLVSVAHLTGTHKGVLKGPGGDVPATSKQVGYLVTHGIEVDDAGKVAKEWFLQDMGGMMAQLGLSPAPARAMLASAPAGEVAIATDSETERKNLAAWNAGIDAFNKKDMAAMSALMADDVVESDQAMAKDATGKAAVEKGLKGFWTAFPDGKLDMKDTWAAGDYVVSMGAFTGTNTGDMGAIKKTGKPITIAVLEIAKFKDGKVTNIWRFRNGMAMAQQLGLVPAPGKPADAKPAR
jgi:steroid delta-isomerase-like uncharacterized protein